MKSKIFILLIILSLGLWLRLSGFTWGIPNEEHFYPYYPDEYTVIMLLQGMDPKKLNFYPYYKQFNRMYPDPVFNYYVIGFAEVVAAKLSLLTLSNDKKFYVNNPSEYGKLYLTGRSVSLLAGLATIVLAYYIASTFYGVFVGFLSALFLAIAPLPVIYSKIMNVAAPVTFWIVLSFFFASKLLSDPRRKWYVLSGIAAGIAFGTKQTALPIAVVIVAAHILSTKRFTVSNDLLISFSCFGAFFFLTNPSYLTHFSEFYQGFMLRARWVVSTAEKMPFTYPVTGLLYNAMGPALWIVAFLGILFAVSKRTPADLLLLSWIIPYYLLNAKAGLDVIRYQNEQLPFLLILGARFFYAYINTHVKTLRISAFAALAVTLMLTSARTTVVVLLTKSQDPRTAASRWISTHISPTRPIGVLLEPSEFSPPVINMSYYARSRYADKTYTTPVYDVRSLEADPELIAKGEPEYMVINRREMNAAGRIKNGEIFLNTIKTKYTLVQEFAVRPVLFGRELRTRNYHTWILPYPVIYVYKKTNENVA